MRCPVLVIHGDRDLIRPHAQGAALAELTGGTLVTLEGSGHGPQARDPVQVNRLMRDFIAPAGRSRRSAGRAAARAGAARCSSPPRSASATRAATSRSPSELRALHPDLEIDWLAQDPVTRVLEAEGERVHPASALLANESAHFESESAEHDLHCFHAWRRMDEILVANFMVFDDLVREEPYDLWIGDEAWELDYYLHENPELKRAAYVWLTDFVGWLPVDDEGALTADYNAEMIEHIDRFPRRARPRAVRRATRTTSSTSASGRTCRRSATGPRRTSTSPATSPASRRSPTARRLRAELGYGPRERSASSPSAAPASAPRCCGA